MAGRRIFSESEKLHLQELIVKHKLNSTITAGNPSLKKQAWARLVLEYNSNETNSKRTEAQLKKCWDNLKTRKKAILAQEKKGDMRIGDGPFNPKPGSSADPMVIEETSVERTDITVQYVIDSDNLPPDTPEDGQSGSCFTDCSASGQQTPETANNIRSQVMKEEFMIRKAIYQRQQEREKELLELMVEEKKWLVKAAEENYKKAVLERKHAEAITHYYEI